MLEDLLIPFPPGKVLFFWGLGLGLADKTGLTDKTAKVTDKTGFADKSSKLADKLDFSPINR
jgi:hypothetical protein